MTRTHLGGCHCGAIRYEADLDLSQGTLKCNCSICSKARAWLIAIDVNAFRLLKGKEALVEYQFGARQIRHLFCRSCGIKSFAIGRCPEGGEFIAVMVNCLETLSDTELANAPVTFVNGRNDDFSAQPEVTSYL